MAVTDSWSCSIHYQGPGNVSIDPQAIDGALQQFTGSMPAMAKIEWWKWNQIAPLTGRYFDQSAGNTTFLATPRIGAGSNGAPQLALCVTLGTAATRGRAHAGRFYLPFRHLAVQNDGRLTTAEATAERDNIHSGLTMLDEALGTAPPIVWSKVGQSFRPVTKIGVGRVVDTQRRRRRSLIEDTQFIVL